MKKKLKLFLSDLYQHMTGSKPPKRFLSALATLLILLTIGTIFYTHVEGWTPIDSLYFTFVTIATVGYGDLHPTTTISKLFTMFLIFLGVGLGLYVISAFTESIVEGKRQRSRRFIELFDRFRKH